MSTSPDQSPYLPPPAYSVGSAPSSDPSQMEVQDVPRTEAPRCECPEHPCRNAADLDDEIVTSPALCTPCLFGCMP